MSMTVQQAEKLLEELNTGLEDPMTRHYGASEHVIDAWKAKLRRLGTSEEELYKLLNMEQGE